MTSPLARAAEVGVALAGAAAVNAALLLVMLGTRGAAAPAVPPAPARIARLEEERRPEPRAPEPRAAERAASPEAGREAEPAAIDLDAPLPDLPPPALVDIPLDLAVPGLSPIAAPQARAEGAAASLERMASTAEARRARGGAGPGGAGPGGAAPEAEAVDQPPRERSSNARPQYPRVARQRQIEGEVLVRLLVDEAGDVVDVEVVRVEGHPSFGEAVAAAARGWRFEPARRGGAPVRVWATKTVKFRLE